MRTGKVEHVLPELDQPGRRVVLDPPRTGAGPALCAAMAACAPAVIVYVACDPAALGRDTAALAAAGYRLTTLRAFDAFPQTHHVECVARFVRVDGPEACAHRSSPDRYGPLPRSDDLPSGVSASPRWPLLLPSLRLSHVRRSLYVYVRCHPVRRAASVAAGIHRTGHRGR